MPRPIPPLTRAAAVLRLLADGGRHRALADIAGALRLPNDTARDILGTLPRLSTSDPARWGVISR
ncbi:MULTISPECIES: helix-turn-helix domain-containing protein [unclassified Kitasatospora]|uniref:helix-turn-helix domain-containing protein n=1 Tax=unclassified Kitasatospora TaxID=2633591 RepID=UPI00070F8F17|nr:MULTISPECIES: helix-turn-helix domain-containing protein [unclassified Kitasatospora]KQV14527.1 hypothetical protein ASC99_30660 [Kitasatospora sp. Root107]KRB68067.1 hypothetical protein ASE03_29385 [Kitasatospora sp. Root187]